MWRCSREPRVHCFFTLKPGCTRRILSSGCWPRSSTASRKCEEALRDGVSSVSRNSTSHGYFAGYSLVQVSRTVVSSVHNYKHVDKFTVKPPAYRCQATPDRLSRARWALSGSVGSRWAWGRWQWPPPIAVGNRVDQWPQVPDRTTFDRRVRWRRTRWGHG